MDQNQEMEKDVISLLDEEGKEHEFEIVDALELDGNYLILLAHDAYDVPRRGKDDLLQEDSDAVFSYLVCCVCPVKDSKVELGYFPGENEFHSRAGQVVAPPELGFLFPAFDGRAANLYNALFYSKKADQIHQEFIDAVFHTEPPMSAAEQKEAFQSALREGLGDACTVEVVQAIHEQLLDRMARHKESKDPEPLEVTAQDVAAILRDCGVGDEPIAAFQEECRELLGEGVLNPANLIDPRRFEFKTEAAAVTVDPERSYLVELREIDGRKYLLVPADAGVEINGFALSSANAEPAGA